MVSSVGANFIEAELTGVPQFAWGEVAFPLFRAGTLQMGRFSVPLFRDLDNDVWLLDPCENELFYSR